MHVTLSNMWLSRVKYAHQLSDQNWRYSALKYVGFNPADQFTTVHNFSPRIKTKTFQRQKLKKKSKKKRERVKKNDTKMKHPQIITYKKVR